MESLPGETCSLERRPTGPRVDARPDKPSHHRRPHAGTRSPPRHHPPRVTGTGRPDRSAINRRRRARETLRTLRWRSPGGRRSALDRSTCRPTCAQWRDIEMAPRGGRLDEDLDARGISLVFAEMKDPVRSTHHPTNPSRPSAGAPERSGSRHPPRPRVESPDQLTNAASTPPRSRPAPSPAVTSRGLCAPT